MSLAATLSAGGMRPASFLPTIKCSSCNDEIEISAMGEHTCGKAAPSTKSAHSSMSSTAHSSVSSSLSNPFSLRQINTNAPAQPSPLQFSSEDAPQTRVRAPTVGSSQTPARTGTRTTPPRVNTDVANKPFLAPIHRAESPVSPATSAYSSSSNGSRRPPLRSMTSPAPRIFDPRPPSPEYSANLDCAFPPFPTSTNSGKRRGSTSSRKASSERASSRTGSRMDLYNLDPKSPMSHAGENVLNRMNTLKSSPFDPSCRRLSNDDRPHQERRSLDKRRPSIPEERRPSEELPPLPSQPLQSSTVEPKPLGVPNASSSASDQQALERKQSTKKMPPERPVRSSEQLSPTFLNQISAEPSSAMPTVRPLSPLRSETLPAPRVSNDEPEASQRLSKIASEPALRNRASSTGTPESGASQPEQYRHPLRSQSKKEARIDYRMQDAPPVPSPVQLHRSESLHRTSESNSSTASSVPSLGNSNSSIEPSPVGSATSSVDILSNMTYEAGKYGRGKEMRVAGLNINKTQQNPGMRAEQVKDRSPPRNFTRPCPPKEIAVPVELPPAIPGTSSWPLDSPTDPAMQNQKIGDSPDSANPAGRNIPLPPAPKEPAPKPANPAIEEYGPYRVETPQPTPDEMMQGLFRSRTETHARPRHDQRPQAPLRSKTDTVPQIQTSDSGMTARSATLPPMPHDGARPPLARRPTTGAKAKCRGCNIQIEGKSVKAADGRLTGRWHKACFVCKTCKEPFTTADFYVINNHPYCEQHYHEKNGSVCSGCHKGIEGQYLETSSNSGPNGREGKKYHRRCFTCFDCRMVLSEDYFETGGRVYCERHALAAMRGQSRSMGPGSPGLAPHGGSSLKAERRTTKLMMM